MEAGTATATSAFAPVSVSTGVAAFDSRVGGLSPGRYYILSGAPGSGKSSAALHLLGQGIEDGDTVAVLTQDDPADVIAQAEFLGYDFAKAAESDRLQLFRYRLDFQRHYSRAAEPSQVFAELKSLLREDMPQRFVVDSVLPLLEGGLAAEEAVDAFARFLEELPCTTYLTVPGDLSDSYYRRIYTRITSGAAGIFHFENLEPGIRQLTIRKLRQGLNAVEPVRFTIRPGAGIVEDLALRSHDDLPAEHRRRVVLLTMGGKLPAEWADALRNYDLVLYDSMEKAFGDLALARYGALLIALNPLAPEPALQLTRELRRAGNGAPILFVSPLRGLRAQTRAQGLRAGGDDFLTDALSPGELIARIDNARARGHRRVDPGSAAALPPGVQPVAESGNWRPMAADRFRQVLQRHVSESAQSFFALVLLEAGTADPQYTWDVLRQCLRIKDGDLVAAVGERQFALYLHDIHRKHVMDLLNRLAKQHAGFASLDGTVVLSYPADADAISAWIGGGDEDELGGSQLRVAGT